MSDKEFKSYQRGHKFSNPSEREKGKIKKEKIKYAKHRKRSRDLTKKMLKEIKHYGDYDEEISEEIEKENFQSRKEKGNLATHKNRFKKLEKYDDFH